MKRIACLLIASMLLSLSLLGCQAQPQANGQIETQSLTTDQIIEKAKAEGEVNSVGMPDSWANWKGTWDDLASEYGLKHVDTDMSSAEELAKFESETTNASADIGDVGIAFGPLAVEKNLTIPYKTSYWDDIPDWAKDQEGHWLLGYTGTLCFMADTAKVAQAPSTWEDIKNGTYKVSIGDVLKANQAQFSVLAAAYAMGGDETNIMPGIEFFADLAKQGRLALNGPGISEMQSGEIEVAILWDFNALNYRDQVDRARFDVKIPSDKTIISGYATIINKYAQHPYAAMLTREYILSDKGQSNLARGYARPIRSNAKIDPDAQTMLLPNDMYTAAVPVKDQAAWDGTTKQLPQLWQENVLIHVK